MENLRKHENNKLLHVLIGDARNIEATLFHVDNIDFVFHEAAIASVPRSVSEPMLVHDVNVNMTLNVMNFCVHKKVKRFIFASTAAVYGALNGKASEALVCKPSSPYGASKLAIENYLSAYERTYGLETVILRYFNVYGSRQKSSDYSGVITIFTNKLLHRETPTIFGDGLQVRDFVHVKDIVQANMLAMESENAKGEVFNVASGNSISILQLLETLRAITDTYVEHKYAEPRVGDMKFGLAKIDKIERELGYCAKIPIKEGLRELVDYIKSTLEIQILHFKKGD
ncbi:MAG: UDP-glucose 4-epimerase [Candidatus Nitrosomirales archaeon]|jgi:UDP-glucose 4-epimerase